MQIPDILSGTGSIAVLGYGREGCAAIDYLSKCAISAERITVLDTHLSERPEGLDETIGFIGNPSAFTDLSKYEIIIKSPWIAPEAYGQACDYERSATLAQLFFDLHPERVIAISGTKGKSTLATLLTRVITDAGYSCAFYGNIGNPPLPDYDPANPTDYIVIELSSYMLDRLEKKNFASVLVNIFPDHLNWHGSFEDYARAKMRLIKGSEFAYIGVQVADAGYLKIYESLYGELPPHEFFDKEGKYCYVDGWWWRDDTKLFESANMRLIGRHLYENFASVIALAEKIGISLESVQKTFENFAGLPHRLQYIDTMDGIEFWDDAISTTPESTTASMTAIIESGRKIETMLLGGLDRGYDYGEFGRTIERLGVRRCVLFPDAGQAIKRHLPESVGIFETTNMDEAVAWAAGGTDGVCLLSTAAPSYSLWKNFEDKGERFQKAIARLRAA